MSPLARRRAGRLATTLVVLSLLVAVFATTAGAVSLGLRSFKTAIDVDLSLTEKTKWTGERAGCFAPFENWDLAYNLDIDSTPKGKKSDILPGITSITNLEAGSGTTPSYGDKGSFKQSSTSQEWELTTQNPAGCPAAPPVPEWATSPTCKKINERVYATIQESKTEGVNSGDGTIDIVRVKKAKPNPFGSSIGASCYRTLHNLETAMVDSEVGISLKSTILTIPVPNLRDKLVDISTGSAKSRPSFKVKVRYWSVCNFFGISPRTAEKPDWTKSPFTQPHQFLGSFGGAGEETRSTCSLDGKGTITVRRVGKTTRL